ncbi:MAG: hypothetical protein EHM70_09095, partial [Chloroflexota bacterium]
MELAMLKGVAGKILTIDLTHRTFRVEQVPDEVYRHYLSGLGLGVKILYDRIPPAADPLGPENILGFVGGVLTGLNVLFAGRFLVVGKSPLTGGWGDSNCGGNLAPAIKQCGYDGIFFEGCAGEPVYIYIHEGEISILPAADLWGKDTVETEDILIKRHGERLRVACIGPAGENMVRFAGIANHHGRVAGRSGLGAVMGSKNLKALALDGKYRIEAANPDVLKRQNKAVAAFMPKGESKLPGWIFGIVSWVLSRRKTANRTDGLMPLPLYRKWGTTIGNEVCLVSGDAPVRNWRGRPSIYPGRVVSPDKLDPARQKAYHCINCPLACGSICSLNGSYRETHRPEYETVTAFGANILNRNLDSIFELNELCNRMGLDTISTGAVVAFAIECYENGLIDPQSTGGLELKWGDASAVRKLVEMIACRQGIGDLLADGVRRASIRLGEASASFAIHAGGQELPMHDPRIDPAYGVQYISDPTPGRHTINSTGDYEMHRLWTQVSWAPEPPQSYSKTVKYENSDANARMSAAGSMYKAIVDSAGICLFGAQIGVDRMGLFDMLNA